MAGPTAPDKFLMGIDDTPPVTPVDQIVDELSNGAPPDDATDAATETVVEPVVVEPSMEDELAIALGIKEAPSPPVVVDADAGDAGDGDGTLAAEGVVPAPVLTPTVDAPIADAPAVDPAVDAATGVVDINTLAEQMFGRQLTQQEAYNLFALSNDLTRLTPQQAASVEAIIYGTPQPMATQPVGQPVAPTSPVPQPGGVGDDLDPEIAAALAPIREQLEQVQSFVTQQSSTQLDAQRAQARTQIDATAAAFTTERALTPDESQSLQYQVAQSGIFPGLVSRHNGDVAAAMNQALDIVYWQTPSFRDREIANRLAAEQTTITATMAKANKAASLAPGGAAVSREDPHPATKEARQEAMVAELSKAMNQS